MNSYSYTQVEKGPSYLDAAVTYEPMVVEFNEANGTFLRDNYGDDFAFVFPAYVGEGRVGLCGWKRVYLCG